MVNAQLCEPAQKGLPTNLPTYATRILTDSSGGLWTLRGLKRLEMLIFVDSNGRQKEKPADAQKKTRPAG
jgi:hypothetical protein